MTDNPNPVPQASRNLTTVAWTVTILASALPNIVWTEVTRTSSEWMEFSKINLLLALAGVAFAWKPLRPLRHYLLVLPAVIGLLALIKHANITLPPLQALFGRTPFDARMQAEQTGKLAVVAAMVGLLLALGYGRRDFFLVRGYLRAPIQPVPLLGFPKPDPWNRFGLQWSVYIAGALAVVMALGMRPDGATMLKVLPMLPSVLFYAALNSFNEEMIIRAPMIATVEPVGGSRHALWMSAYLFGIAHYFGTPGGIAGGVASIFMGWILGKAMVETRGLFWAWWIHFLSDIAIFVFLAAALVK